MRSSDWSSATEMGKRLDPWEIIKRHEVFVAAPWIKLEAHQVRLPDGKVVDDYYHITLQEHTVIFAETTEGKVIVERQYKHGAGKVCLVLPAGFIEEGEDSLTAARRELLEETGYASDDWQSLGSFVPHGTYGCGMAHLFRARSAQQVAKPNSGDLEEMEIMLMKPEDLLAAALTGNVAGLGAVTAIALATNPQI